VILNKEEENIHPSSLWECYVFRPRLV